MKSRGTRIDDLTVEPIGEDRPGFYRMIRFGNYSLGDGSKEMIINLKELINFKNQADAILLNIAKYGDSDGKKKTKKDTG